MPPLFGDLYKPVKDLLTKKYNGESHKFDMKAKDGVTFNPVFTRGADGNVAGTVSVEGNYDPCSWCAMKLKYQIATAGNLKTTITVDKLAEGLKVEGNWDAAMGDDVSKDSYDAKATYTAKPGNMELKVVKGKATSAELTAAFNVLEGLNMGAITKFDLLKKTQTSVGFSGAYLLSKKTSLAALLTRDFGKDGAVDTLKAGFVTKGSPYTFGAEYATKLADPKKGVITVGGETKLEGGQTIKVKADSKGTAGFSLQHAISKEFNLCSSIELAAGKEGKYGSKFGTELVYSA